MDFANPLFNLATVLIAGIIGGELISKLKLPKVTGWIGTGILIRTFSLPGLEPENLVYFSPFTDAVLGYIAFTVGAALHLPGLRNAGKRLSFLLMCEAIITPTIVISLLYLFGGISLQTAMLLGAIAIAGAPGTTVLVAGEARARGILTQTLIAAVALIDMVAVAAYAFAQSFLGNEMTGLATWGDALTAVGTEFAWAFGIGLSVAGVAIGLTNTIIGPAFLGPTMVVAILASWGLGKAVGVSSIMACTFAGIALSNLRHETVRSAEAYLNSIGGLLFAGFYTLAGMRLDFGLVPPLAGLVGLYFGARLVGKSVSAFVAMTLAGMTDKVRRYLGLALLPHGGVAVGLIFLVQSDPRLAEHAPIVTTVGLAALAINQLLGPSATRYSIAQAGEAGKDRPRLLDFLREPHIVTKLQSTDVQDAIKQLVSRLYVVDPPPIPQEEFLKLALDPNTTVPTAFGQGLMMPHVRLKDGQAITGVLGLSAKGLNFPSPDNRPIHAILLLATPHTDRNRHLAVLSAFATTITKDANLCEQLYHARSPAHAYDVLHADEAEDINYFLDEAIEHFVEDDFNDYDVKPDKA